MKKIFNDLGFQRELIKETIKGIILAVIAIGFGFFLNRQLTAFQAEQDIKLANIENKISFDSRMNEILLTKNSEVWEEINLVMFYFSVYINDYKNAVYTKLSVEEKRIAHAEVASGWAFKNYNKHLANLFEIKMKNKFWIDDDLYNQADSLTQVITNFFESNGFNEIEKWQKIIREHQNSLELKHTDLRKKFLIQSE